MLAVGLVLAPLSWSPGADATGLAPPGQTDPLKQALKQASVDGKYRMLLRQIRAPEDEKKYGRFHDLGQRQPAPGIGRNDPQKGYRVYVAPYWYVWRDLSAALALLTLQAKEPVASPPAADAALDIVLPLPDRPMTIRLHLEVDGKPFRAGYHEALREYLRVLFAYLDRNGDGHLDEAEARRLPPPLFNLPDASSDLVHVAFNFSALDADGDGRISPEELVQFYRDYEAGPFEETLQPIVPLPGGQLGDALFEQLDTNKDGKLSRQELAAAEKLLARLDADDDELLSPPEIAPGLFPPPQPGLEGSAPMPQLPVPSRERPRPDPARPIDQR